MDDKAMRDALLRKLSDPNWIAAQDRRYREIVGESEIIFAPPPSRPQETVVALNALIPTEEAPTTVEALWMGNWQRSSGALTITRFPDDTVVLDYPDGARTLFHPCPAARGRFTWLSESMDAAARRTETYRCPDRYKEADEALLEMHLAALALFRDAATEIEG